MTDIAEKAFRWAWTLLDGLAAAGVRRAIISPGSRSTPLTLAALRHSGLECHVVLDERSAGFFALGLAKAEGAPVALIATSGSAIANWAPAVVEADLARVPLVLLSADRPPELHGRGANQTMEQSGLFRAHVRAFFQLPPPEDETGWLADLAVRLVAEARGEPAGPVHVNLPFREPLTAADASAPRSGAKPRQISGRLTLEEGALKDLGALIRGRGAIFCGSEDLGPEFKIEVGKLAVRLDVPIFADLLSGLRFGVEAQSHVLAYPESVARLAPAFDWALRFGPAPIGKGIGGWQQESAGARQIVVSAHRRYADPDLVATHFVEADPAFFCATLDGEAAPTDWRDELCALDRAARRAAEQICAGNAMFEGSLLRGLFAHLPPETPIFLANSLTIRAAEWFGGSGGTALRFFGQRELSGIDGNLSSAAGVAAAHGRAVAVVGDLAFLHDVNALSLARKYRLTIVLMDNGGGGIFDHLAQAALPEFDSAWGAPQTFDASTLAAAFGLDFRRANDAEAVAREAAACCAAGEAAVIHARIDRAQSLGSFKNFFRLQQGTSS